MRSVLFIHGYSQSFLSWIGQLGARRLGGPLRLLAMDLRGHGLSGKPPGVYTAKPKITAVAVPTSR